MQTYRVELDTVNDLPSPEFDARRKELGISDKVLIENGPAGGWPVIEYTGTKEALETMIDEYFTSGDAEEDAWLKTHIKPVV